MTSNCRCRGLYTAEMNAHSYVNYMETIKPFCITQSRHSSTNYNYQRTLNSVSVCLLNYGCRQIFAAELQLSGSLKLLQESHFSCYLLMDIRGKGVAYLLIEVYNLCLTNGLRNKFPFEELVHHTKRQHTR